MATINSTLKRWFLICLSFFSGMFLMFLPLPSGFNWLGPLWLVLILLYWVLMMPQYVNVGIAWGVGIFTDIVYNGIIGEHALGLVLIVFLVIKIRQKILPLGFLKMAPIISGLLVLYQLLIFLMRVYGSYYFNTWSILGGAIVGILLWPPVALLLFNCQQKFRI